MLTSHAVQLDANFSKYGYSAHLRTKDGPSTDSLADSSFDKETWHSDRQHGTAIHFYQKPIVRQYFHKGLLWRAKEAQEVASYELFIDLFYVGIIAITGDSAAEHPTAQSLLRFAITFIMGWKFWTDIGVLVSWFDSDDVIRRVSVLFLLTCLLGFTTNMVEAWERTYAPLVGFYLAARLFVTSCWIWYAWRIPMVRGSMLGNALLSLIPAALWMASVSVEEPKRQGLIWVSILFDLFGQFSMVLLQRPGSPIARFVPESWKTSLEFYPATNIEHRIERTNAFVTLVFGSCVLGLLYQSSVAMGINAFFGKAVLGLVQTFMLNWVYFEIDSFNLHTHAIRRHVFSGKLDLQPSHADTNDGTSVDMVLRPPPLHHVLRPLRISPRCPSPCPRHCLRTPGFSIRNLRFPLRRPHLRRPSLVLLRRSRHLAPLPHCHLSNTRPPYDSQSAPPQAHPSSLSRRCFGHHTHAPSCAPR